MTFDEAERELDSRSIKVGVSADGGGYVAWALGMGDVINGKVRATWEEAGSDADGFKAALGVLLHLGAFLRSIGDAVAS